MDTANSQPGHRLRVTTILVLALLALALTACQAGAVLSDVTVEPTTISPNADGKDDLARIHYAVGRTALVTTVFIDADGQEHVWRKDERRSPNAYDGLFNGIIDGRMLTDGTYTWRITATPVEGGAPSQVQGRVVIQGADQSRPDITQFTVVPAEFTPNQDGINDRVTVSYVLAKAATARVYLEDEKGRFVVSLLEQKKGPVEPGQPGRHQYDYDAGVDADAPPPPDGTYNVVVEARDSLGITVVERKPLTIREGGVPRVTIMDSALGPSVIPLGATLSITATVKNIGTTPIRTQGPPPGTVYTLNQSYNSLRLPQSSGAFRLGATCDALAVDLDYPYRWQLGDPSKLERRSVDGRTLLCPPGAPNGQCPLEERAVGDKLYAYLLPGQLVQVTGQIRFTDPPLRRTTLCYLALIQEDVRKHEESVNPTRITVEY
ncbi:MAG: hypothetical protein KIT87_18685 [Anaerolineae bacterium]|nr:hypothetical protein [Anaerolineae bacterium]